MRIPGRAKFLKKMLSERNKPKLAEFRLFSALILPPSPSALSAPRRPSLRGAFFCLPYCEDIVRGCVQSPRFLSQMGLRFSKNALMPSTQSGSARLSIIASEAVE